MDKIDTKGWKPYIVGKLFDVSRPTARKQSDYDIGDMPFVASGSFNNGIQAYLNPKSSDDYDRGKCITISPVDGYAFYQEDDFLGRGGAGSSIIIIRNEHLNRYNGQYIASVLRHIFSSWTYSDMGTKDLVKTSTISLPSKGKEPDWDYMEQYMRGIEERAQKSFEVLQNMATVSKKNIDVSKWATFKVKNVVRKLYLKCKKEDFNKTFDTSLEKTDEFNLPLVNAKHYNNGIMYYGREQDFEFAEMSIDIVQNGASAVGDVYAQPQRTGVLEDAYLVKPLYENISVQALFYLATVIEKCVKQYFSYDEKCTWDKVKEREIKLPVNDEGNPDYEYMTNYMMRIEHIAKNNLNLFL